MARNDKLPPNDDNNKKVQKGDAFEPDEGAGVVDFDPAKLNSGAPSDPRQPADPGDVPDPASTSYDGVPMASAGTPPELTQPAAASKDDLFTDLANLRLNQEISLKTLGVKKKLTTIPIRKPANSWFIRTHPTFRMETCVIELKEDQEVYLVPQWLCAELAGESTFGLRALFVAVNKQKVIFVWLIRLSGPDDKKNSWNQSALEGAIAAEKAWIRIASNTDLKAYEIFEATADYGEPQWPDITLNEILRIAFKGRVIDSLDHPVLKRLRGEV